MKHKKILKFFLLSAVIGNISNAHEVKKLEAVTVTANKIEEKIQEVPQSITIIDAQELEEKGIKTVEDIIREIPNMSITLNRGISVNFRGLNNSLFTANNPIVIYIDGIPIYNRSDFSTMLENIERIEVLRGPQGTLYGKDAIGGVINIITKEPTNKVNGSLKIEYGKNNYKRGTFNLNSPIIENKLFFNLKADLTANDGWLTNSVNNDEKSTKEEDKRFSTSLYYKITPKLSTKLVLNKEKIEDYGYKGYGIVGEADLNKFNRDNAKKNGLEMPANKKQNIDSQSLNIKYEEDKYLFEGITVHRKTKKDNNYDFDFTTGTIYDGSNFFDMGSSNTYSQELRLSNKNTDGIRFIGGLYIEKENINTNKNGFNVEIEGIKYVGNDTSSNFDNNTQAIFAQTMVPLTNKLELTLGGRYQKIKKEFNSDASGYRLNFATFDYDKSNFKYSQEETWNTFIPKVALNYKINNNLSSFTSISKGYMPGGFNTQPSTNIKEDNLFEPQQSTNYEIGIKGGFTNFNFSTSIFRMDIKDVHVYRRLNTGGIFVDNAAKAYSQGIEFDFDYFPIKNIEISAAFGYTKAKYKSYDIGDYNFNGQEIETTPSHTANLSIAYYHPRGFYARTDIKNQGAMSFYNDASKSFPKEDGYTLIDVKMGYKYSNFDFYAYVKNLTDEKYINMYEANNIFSMATFGEPRFFGIGFKYTF